MDAKVEFLTDELKKLVGWGAHPKRLPLLPTLRSLVDVDEKASKVTVGYIMQRYLIAQVAGIQEPLVFDGRPISARDTRRAFLLLFRLEGGRKYADDRRERAMSLLGAYCAVGTWRRPDGPERDLMRLLAERMIFERYQRHAA